MRYALFVMRYPKWPYCRSDGPYIKTWEAKWQTRKQSRLQMLCSKSHPRLKGEGVAPTNRKILHELGGGSMKTIATYLREWKAQQSIQAPARADAVEIPQLVLEALNQAGLISWAAATAEIRREPPVSG
jgi:SOS-response transcriptional repressor LexA